MSPLTQEGQLAATETSVFWGGKAHPADDTSLPPHLSFFLTNRNLKETIKFCHRLRSGVKRPDEEREKGSW